MPEAALARLEERLDNQIESLRAMEGRVDASLHRLERDIKQMLQGSLDAVATLRADMRTAEVRLDAEHADLWGKINKESARISAISSRVDKMVGGLMVAQVLLMLAVSLGWLG